MLDYLKAYLEHQIESGRLRPHDVRSSARAFAGMLMLQTAGELLFPALVEEGLTAVRYLKAATELFVQRLEGSGYRLEAVGKSMPTTTMELYCSG